MQKVIIAPVLSVLIKLLQDQVKIVLKTVEIYLETIKIVLSLLLSVNQTHINSVQAVRALVLL